MSGPTQKYTMDMLKTYTLTTFASTTVQYYSVVSCLKCV